MKSGAGEDPDSCGQWEQGQHYLGGKALDPTLDEAGLGAFSGSSEDEGGPQGAAPSQNQRAGFSVSRRERNPRPNQQQSNKRHSEQKGQR